MRPLYIIKLGGSAITEKSVENRPRLDVISRLAKEIASIEADKIIIHGAGSFGHPTAKRYKIHEGFLESQQLLGFSKIKVQLLILNKMVVDSLARRGVASTPFTPSAFIIAENDRIVKAELEPLTRLLSLGLTPVLHGDIVSDRAKGFSIVSGDQLASYLAKQLKPRLVVYGCDVDGVYDDDPRKNRQAKLIPTISVDDQRIWGSTPGGGLHDVTGGMAGKLREALELAEAGIESVILNATKPRSLAKLIKGEPVTCSRILPAGKLGPREAG
ncbi:MAG: isopentenyl phosphate kinase [Candidatus Bathyarchaeia archaeon]